MSRLDPWVPIADHLLVPSFQKPFKTGSVFFQNPFSVPPCNSHADGRGSDWVTRRNTVVQAADRAQEYRTLADIMLRWVETNIKYRRNSTFNLTSLPTKYHFIICLNQKSCTLIVCFFFLYPYIGKKVQGIRRNQLLDAFKQKMTWSELLCGKTIVTVESGRNWRTGWGSGLGHVRDLNLNWRRAGRWCWWCRTGPKYGNEIVRRRKDAGCQIWGEGKINENTQMISLESGIGVVPLMKILTTRVDVSRSFWVPFVIYWFCG